MQIDHIDCNKLNNYYQNLRWCTPKENTHYAIDNGLRDINGCRLLTDDKVDEVKKYLTFSTLSYSEISRLLNIDINTIIGIDKGIIYKNLKSEYDEIPNLINRSINRKINRLPDEKVKDIIKDLAITNCSYNKIAIKHNVVSATVKKISKGEFYKDIKSEYRDLMYSKHKK